MCSHFTLFTTTISNIIKGNGKGSKRFESIHHHFGRISPKNMQMSALIEFEYCMSSYIIFVCQKPSKCNHLSFFSTTTTMNNNIKGNGRKSKRLEYINHLFGRISPKKEYADEILSALIWFEYCMSSHIVFVCQKPSKCNHLT